MYRAPEKFILNRPKVVSPVLIVSIFATMGLIGILNHSMWRDEFNTWLIVRDSHSLLEMLSHVKYQGHTALWAICLSFLRNFSQSPVIMQLFHWATAVIAISIFWSFSPFKYSQKILFTFGYIPFYQYLLVARPYVLGMLFLFAFCAIFPYRKRSYIPAAITLALLANSNAYGLLIAIALASTLAIELIYDTNLRSHYFNHAHPLDLLISALIIVISFGFAVYILTPPADSYNHGGLDAWKLEFSLRRILRAWGRIFAGYTLIVPSQYKWPDLIVGGMITLIAVTIFLLHLVKKPLSFFFFGLANGVLLAFTYFRFMGIGPRHFAHYYLVLIVSLWLAAHLSESHFLAKRLSLPNQLLAISQKWQKPILTTILLIQFLGGLYVFPRDLLIPFSAARETANYIRESGWAQEFIVASRDANMASISGYLNRKLYYPELQAMGSFTLFGGDRKPDNHEDHISHEEVLKQVSSLLKQRADERILLILHIPLEATVDTLNIQPIREFERSWIHSERYYLYWATLSDSSP